MDALAGPAARERGLLGAVCYVGSRQNLDFNCFAQFFQLNLHTGCQNRNTWRFGGIAANPQRCNGEFKMLPDNVKAFMITDRMFKNVLI